MDFVNQTPHHAFWTVGYGKDGRERVTVVIKASYRLPAATSRGVEPLELLTDDAREPLVEADQFEKDPANSAPLRETDFAHEKPCCDVLLNGCAYARGARKAVVGLRVGSWSKGFVVHGPRAWIQRFGGLAASKAEPFEKTAFSYATAYGGSELDPNDPARGKSLRSNPVGRGYHPYRRDLEGLLLPNTERPGQPVVSVTGDYQAMALGPIGRSWAPRLAFAGTYDEAWTQRRAPYLPDDFDGRYYQAAPVDQQIPYPRGGEEVVLLNLTPAQRLQFMLPTLAEEVLFVPHRGDVVQQPAQVDALLFEPERNLLCLTARTVFATKQSLFDLQTVVVGAQERSWLLRLRAERSGKVYYPSLGAMSRAKHGGH